jgi:hypothetical protein
MMVIPLKNGLKPFIYLFKCCFFKIFSTTNGDERRRSSSAVSSSSSSTCSLSSTDGDIR